MGQEFFINSQALEDKIRTSLPSQGGAGAGLDLSASTQIIPIIDLTETATGSVLRQDLQSSLSFNSATTFSVQATTVDQITNTGYWRVIGVSNVITRAAGSFNQIFINDGASDKVILSHSLPATSTFALTSITFDFIVFLEAGHTLKIQSFTSDSTINGSTRQIAALDGTLTNP